MQPSVILVTGGNGQLGSELRRLTASSNHQFFFTDIDELDITNDEALEQFFSDNRPQFVINCAAYTAVDKAETDIDKARLINIDAVALLAEKCHKFQSAFIHISTDFVFEGKAFVPVNENDEPKPLSIYGKTKHEGETKALSICSKTLIIRTSWLYSSFGNNFVKTMLRLGKERTELSVIYDQIGTPTYARDLAETILIIIDQQSTKEQISADRFGIYHYSNEGVASWYDFAHAIFRIENMSLDLKPIKTEAYPTPAKRPHYSVLDKSKIKSTFNITIPHWRDSLEQCLKEI